MERFTKIWYTICKKLTNFYRTYGGADMNGAQEVSVAKIAELLDLKNLIDDIDLKARKIECSDVNRPALQLAGYFDYFDSSYQRL